MRGMYEVVGYKFTKYNGEYQYYLIIVTPCGNECCVEVKPTLYNHISVGDYIEDFKRDENDVIVGCTRYEREIID